jgi:hypothetical protein
MLACANPAFDGPVFLFQDIIEVLYYTVLELLLQTCNTWLVEGYGFERDAGLTILDAVREAGGRYRRRRFRNGFLALGAFAGCAGPGGRNNLPTRDSLRHMDCSVFSAELRTSLMSPQWNLMS